jgi:AraC-like DNA-binding protein
MVSGHTQKLPSSSGGFSRLAYARGRAAGIRLRPLLKKAGLSIEQMENPQLRLSVRSQIEFINAAASALSDDFLGFHLAQVPDLREIGLLYYVLASSETLVDALKRSARYSSIVNDGVFQKFTEGKQLRTSLHYVGISRHLDRHQTEFWMTIIVRLCRQLTGLRIVPTRVQFVHYRNQSSAEFFELLGEDIEFGANSDEIIFERANGNLPIVSADPYLNNLLLKYCEEALSQRTRKSDPFRISAENAIARLLPHGKARSEIIARELGVSQRTLARRLAMEGMTFSHIVEALRRDLADRHLADDDLSISQIAWLLGYREVGAFSHAYKRWTGKTPREARFQLR